MLIFFFFAYFTIYRLMNPLEKIKKELLRCSSLVNKSWVIEIDQESLNNSYKGIIIGGIDSPFWGSIFHFILLIDEEKLTEPPKVIFNQGLYHPLIDPTFGIFCFPQNDYSLTSRMSMELFLDKLVDFFSLKVPFQNPFNLEAFKTFESNPQIFWAILRQKSLDLIQPIL